MEHLLPRGSPTLTEIFAFSFLFLFDCFIPSIVEGRKKHTSISWLRIVSIRQKVLGLHKPRYITEGHVIGGMDYINLYNRSPWHRWNGFDLWISSVRSDRSTNCVTTTAHLELLLRLILPLLCCHGCCCHVCCCHVCCCHVCCCHGCCCQGCFGRQRI